ncbi:adenosylmethionine--8-amino-7-oxononanoate transaminase [Mesonia aquimarina]|uniref:adenosylmethionine--8-amino-7-oxononanoate transaminase n=1 Tax=Mesonia aquimarina TaxID=1504967 RepID=UPI000EF5F15D|nr:adenosylmethionine--8-amino-7-oxononanoate transaminase [Mesonia aquimarina]
MNITERDQQYIWHPLTQHKVQQEILAVKKTKGVYITDEDNNVYIDAISSWYTSIYGHCNDYILDKVNRQMQQLDQVVFTGFTHQPAVDLAEALIGILPSEQQKIFFNDNGSTATEVGIKMALQYHHNQNHERKTMLAFEEGFHGDTFGAMSVSNLSVYHGAFEDHFLSVKRIPVPNGKNTGEILEQIKSIHKETPLAGFIYEPLVQGAAAMKIHDKNGLQEILAFCKTRDIILVADEVMTGFGKTGKKFASDYLSVQPDVVCMSKALTAGLLPMGATSCSQKIFDAFYDDDLAKGLFHGHTYTANPLSCAAALAGIELLNSEKIQQGIKKITEANLAFEEQIKLHPKVNATRTMGVIFALDLAVDLQRYGKARNKIFNTFLSKGVYLRPLGRTIYIVPPYVIKQEELAEVYKAIVEVLDGL